MIDLFIPLIIGIAFPIAPSRDTAASNVLTKTIVGVTGPLEQGSGDDGCVHRASKGRG